MESFSSFLKRKMKQEFVVMSQGFEKNRKAYEKRLRSYLLINIDRCLQIDDNLSNEISFGKYRHLILKTKIFQDTHVDPDLKCTSNFEQLERLANWLIDPDSDPDYEEDTYEITEEVFDKTPESVKAYLLTQLEYNLNLYKEAHTVKQDRT